MLSSSQGQKRWAKAGMGLPMGWCGITPVQKIPLLHARMCPEFPYDNRGFWADEYLPAILFYDPAVLAKVAAGEWEPWQPQPYALVDLTEYWFDPVVRHELYKRDLVGAAAFDRANGLLYIVERLGDGSKSVIHVFGIRP